MNEKRGAIQRGARRYGVARLGLLAGMIRTTSKNAAASIPAAQNGQPAECLRQMAISTFAEITVG
jgi:hypothetical protein